LPFVAETGHVRLEHVTRGGEVGPAWFRGPLVPAAVPRSEAPPDPNPQPGDPEPPPPLAHHADQLHRVVPDGSEDLGYAAAFEIGRLLALSQPGVVAAMARWRQEAFGAARVASVVDSATTELAPAVREALARPDPLVRDVDGLRAHTVGARAMRAVVDALGTAPEKAFGAARPVADPGVAARHLAQAMRGGDKALLAGLGVPVDGVPLDDPEAVLGAVTAAPVRVTAEVAEAVDAATLRARLEDAVGALAADAASRDGVHFARALRQPGDDR
jgi:hypothetical protein